ncbi:hypothetical protein [Actinomadura terrae]|uniref:hypothetical protein n=1 Tax=Actinomadura terrae TaxID=604353 RepID=UPI001FA749AE|nr:hypothetical protein [Actinomadura terrae]
MDREPVRMHPKQLAQTAAAAFEEVMGNYQRPKALIRSVTLTACERAEDALANKAEAPTREAFRAAFDEVSEHVRLLLLEAGQLPETVTAIRDAAQGLSYRALEGHGNDWDSPYVQNTRPRIRPDE